MFHDFPVKAPLSDSDLSIWRPANWPLRWRVSVSASLILLVGLLSLQLLQQRFEREAVLTAAQQRAQVSADRTADLIDRRVRELMRATELVSAGITPALMQDRAALAQFLQDKPIARSMFANTFVADASGQVLALVDGSGSRLPQLSIADRPYFQQLMRTSAGVASEPVQGRFSAEPVMIFAHPIVVGGKVVGAFGGALRLASRDLLTDLAVARTLGVGQTSVTDAEGHLLAHPLRSALLQQITAVESLPANIVDADAQHPQLRDWARASPGDELLATARVVSTGWRVWYAQTEADLTAPLHSAQRKGMLGAAALAAGLFVLLLLTVQRQFGPMVWLAANAPSIADGHQELPQQLQQDPSEVGQVARALDAVLRERGEAAKQLQAIKARLTVVLNAAPMAMAFTRERRFEFVNEEAERLLGWQPGELVGREAMVIFASADAYAAMGPRVADAFASQGVFSEEIEMRHTSGVAFWVRLQGRPADRFDASAGTIWSWQDVGEERRERQQLQHAAAHDTLTGLANRDTFMARLETEWAEAVNGEPATVLMMDLDHFKPLNDAHGHAAGDAMLVAVARELHKPVRAQDLVARLGGDEFGLILPQCSPAAAMAIAERLRQSVAHLRVDWGSHRLSVGLSLGLAPAELSQNGAVAWLAAADAALYRAKHDGRGRVAFLRVLP